MYQNLDPDQIVKTVTRLKKRIENRFPDSGLGKVCGEIAGISESAKHRIQTFSRPNHALRLSIGFLILLILSGLVLTVLSLKMPEGGINLDSFVGMFEAGLNSLVLIGAAVVFLVTVENRIKRARALKAVAELRSLAHVIDMHQLTKDPEQIYSGEADDPEDQTLKVMAPEQLTRYLDYCSEMLSLLGKIAALYMEEFNDSVVLASINEVESLTTGLSRKIWQKIMIIHNVESQRPMSK